MQEDKDYRNPKKAALFSAICTGVGQIYNGDVSKGIGLLILYAISWWSVSMTIGFVTTPILWLFGIYDAYHTAVGINAAKESAMKRKQYEEQRQSGETVLDRKSKYL